LFPILEDKGKDLIEQNDICGLKEEHQQFKECVFGFSLKLEFFQAYDRKVIDGLDIISNVYNSFFYDEIDVSRFYDDQVVHIQPSFHEYHETKVSEFEFLRILNNNPRYDEYQDDEDQISTSTHMKFCSTEPIYESCGMELEEDKE